MCPIVEAILDLGMCDLTRFWLFCLYLCDLTRFWLFCLYLCDLTRFCLFCLYLLVLLLPKICFLIGCMIFRLWAYLMKVIIRNVLYALYLLFRSTKKRNLIKANLRNIPATSIRIEEWFAMLGTKTFLTDILLFNFSIRPLCFSNLKYFKNYLVFQSLDWACMMKVIPEMYRTHTIRYLCF